MNIKGKYHVKHALIVNKEGIERIILLLTDYFPKGTINFAATLKNNADVRFNTAEELYSYDNAGKYRIIELSIDANKFDAYRITFYSRDGDYFHLIKWTTIISYQLDEKKKIISLEAQLKETFQEMKPAFWYNLISIFPFTPFRNFIALTWLASIFLKSFDNSILIILIIIAVILTIVDILQNLLFPSLQFAIGKGVDEMSKREKYRKTLIGIIITIITLGVSVLSFLKK